MKLDKNYKMDKLTKIMLSNILDQSHRALTRKLFAEAETSYANNKKKMSVKHVVNTDSDD
jgi:arsenate reductase-like glutaredoxin family protein